MAVTLRVPELRVGSPPGPLEGSVGKLSPPQTGTAIRNNPTKRKICLMEHMAIVPPVSPELMAG